MSLSSEFAAAPTDGKKRLIIAADALEKAGKTNFGLSMPEELVVFNFDFGLEGVVEKVATTKKIYVEDCMLNLPPDANEKQVEQIAGAGFEKFEKKFKRAIALKAKSIFIDTATDLWEMMRLQEFGKLSANAHHYVKLNARYRELIKNAQQGSSNLVLLHQLIDEYETKVKMTNAGPKEESVTTGRLKRAGFKKTNYLTHAEVLLTRDKTGEREFHLEIVNSRHNAEIVGEVLDGKMVSFPQLAMMIMPDTKTKDWK